MIAKKKHFFGSGHGLTAAHALSARGGQRVCLQREVFSPPHMLGLKRSACDLSTVENRNKTVTRNGAYLTHDS